MEINHVPLARNMITEALSIPDPQEYFKKQRNSWLKENWDGRINYWEPLGENIIRAPLGLRANLENALKKRGVDYVFNADSTTQTIPYEHLVRDIQLETEQELVCQKILAVQTGAIELATASGKTECFANAIACYNKIYPENQIVILVPKRALLRQTYKRLCIRLPHIQDNIGMLGDGKRDMHCKIVVATPDTASAPKHVKDREVIKKFIKGVKLLILDEAHKAKSNKWQTVINECPDDCRMWAFSGKVTFFSAKEKHKQFALEAMFGPPVHSGSVNERLCPVKVKVYRNQKWDKRFDDLPLTGSVSNGTYVSWRINPEDSWKKGIWRGPDIDGNVPVDMLDNRGRKMKDRYGIYTLDNKPVFIGNRLSKERSNVIYYTVHDIALMEFIERNEWAEKLAHEFHAKGEQFLITVRRIRHAHKLWNRLRANLPVGIMTGNLGGAEQEKVLNRLNSGTYSGAVCVSSIVEEGVDIPALVHLIKLDGFAGEQVLEQQKGRVQRISDGKECGYVHIPRDTQCKMSNSACARMITYYRRRGIPLDVIEVE